MLAVAAAGLTAAAPAEGTPAVPGAGAPAAAAVVDTVLPASSALTWGTNGRVTRTLPVGDRVVVAGDFSAAVSPSGRTVPMSNLGVFVPATGAFDPSFTARTDGEVHAAASDGTTLYLGGTFTAVNGQPRAGLAAVSLATGALTAWAPAATGTVLTLALSGSSVFVGGSFSSVRAGGLTTGAYLARLTTSGSVSSTPVPTVDGQVQSFLVADAGATLFVGGDFSTMNGNSTAARRTAKVVVATGALVTSFRSGTTNGPNRSPVDDLALVGTTLVVAAGGGGGACAALDATTGATRWAKKANGDMQAVAIVDGIAYCGGHFGGTDSFDNQDRDKLAAVDLATGTTLDYAPRIDSALGVFDLETDGERLVLGGDFTRFGTTAGVGHLALVLPADLRTPPAPVDALGGHAYDGAVELTWDQPSTDGGSRTTSYTVTRREGTRSVVVGKRLKDLFLTDTTAVNGHTYTYTVAATNAVGTTTAAPTGPLTPAPGAAVPPGAPRDPLAIAGELATDVSWQPPTTTGGSPITAYRLYRSTDGATPGLLTTLAAGARTFHDPGVVPTSTYRYEIAAVNAAGQGARVTTATVRPEPARPPQPKLTVTAGPGTAATLTWTVPPSTSGSPVTKYIVLRDRIRLVSRSATSQTGGGYVDATVVSGRTYRYQVRSVSAGGTSPASTSVDVTIPEAPRDRERGAARQPLSP